MLNLIKILILSLGLIMTGCNSKVEKTKEVTKQPVLKTKEELKNEMLEDMKKERKEYPNAK